jgi:hypothetical protein
MGALPKTDALDARMLAAFARVLHQHPERERFVKPLADAELQRLQALVLRRRQLVQMITSERQRMRVSHVAARPSIERVVEFLKTELGDSDADVAAHVQSHHAGRPRGLHAQAADHAQRHRQARLEVESDASSRLTLKTVAQLSPQRAVDDLPERRRAARRECRQGRRATFLDTSPVHGFDFTNLWRNLNPADIRALAPFPLRDRIAKL